MVSAAVLLAGAGCADDGGDDGNGGEATPTTTAPETSTTLSREEQDEEALRQLAEDWFETSRAIVTRDADLDEAEQYLAGEFLENYRGDVIEFMDSGQVIERDDRTTVSVEEITVDGDSAEIVECLTDADVLREASGAVINDEVSSSRLRTEASLTDGGWRLTMRETIERFEGTEECELS